MEKEVITLKMRRGIHSIIKAYKILKKEPNAEIYIHKYCIDFEYASDNDISLYTDRDRSRNRIKCLISIFDSKENLYRAYFKLAEDGQYYKLIHITDIKNKITLKVLKDTNIIYKIRERSYEVQLQQRGKSNSRASGVYQGQQQGNSSICSGSIAVHASK